MGEGRLSLHHTAPLADQATIHMVYSVNGRSECRVTDSLWLILRYCRENEKIKINVSICLLKYDDTPGIVGKRVNKVQTMRIALV